MAEELNRKSWFRKHWVISSIFVVILLIVIVSSFSGNETSNSTGNVVDELNNQQEKISDSPQKSNEKLTILNHELTYGDYGNLIIAGSAKNTVGRELSYCQIDAKFYDADKAVIGTSLANINNLGEDETWKFEIYYIGMDTYNVKSYVINLGSCW